MTTPENPYSDPLSDVQDDASVNPYASPLSVDEVNNVVVPADVASNWYGGWLLVVPSLGLICVATLFALDVSGPGGFQLLAIPTLAVLFIALLVRGLHHRVRVEWLGFLGIASLMGIASYVLFIPVCIVVGIPTAIAIEFIVPGSARMNLPWMAAIFATFFVIGLLVAGIMRLYLRKRSRQQYLETWEQLEAAPFNYPGLYTPSKEQD